MDIQLLLVPYDSGQRGRRCGAGPEHLVHAGLPAHLQRQGHIVTAIHIIEDDPAYPPAEIRTGIYASPRPRRDHFYFRHLLADDRLAVGSDVRASVSHG